MISSDFKEELIKSHVIMMLERVIAILKLLKRE